ncbi:HUWE1-associated protein modifying stress responses [Sorex araneus]|uniref:HUWE1-associated protein modifying stress responses n=1 Tax=Sorex araneus TaxID=42254 RepID=UPI002433BF6C|nr:HUWE1-associated protein modifying stress responses [Sorex araneus]
MEEAAADAEADEAEPWLSKWERQCLAEAEQGEPADAGGADGPGLQGERQRLWQLFQLSAIAVAQLYKDAQAGPSVWDPFQHAAMAVTSLYQESGDAHRRSFELGVQVGRRRRSRDLLDWARKGRSTIPREDLIGFLCGKDPPTSRAAPRAPRSPPKPPAAAEPPGPEPGSSAREADLRPFHDAIALHGLSGALESISVGSGVPRGAELPPRSPPTEGAAAAAASDAMGEVAFSPDSAGTRKRTSASCGDGVSDSPTPKRHRLL